MRRWLMRAVAVGTLTAPGAVSAQGLAVGAASATGAWPHAWPVPGSIVGTGSARLHLVPDRARMQVSVQTSGPTAAAAAAANASRSLAVRNALQKAGISVADVSTSAYDISPQYRYANGAPPAVTGYTVTNSVTALVRDVRQVGRVLDAAVAGGANGVSSLAFYASSTDSAREAGIATAVARARTEAATAARAAGGSLGPLLSLDIAPDGSGEPPRPVMFAAMAMAGVESTPISPGQATVDVSVTARWQFVAATAVGAAAPPQP